MSQLTIRCLGGLDVRLGERQVSGFESYKVKALLAYLAVQRERTFSREHLAALLWPEKPDEAARRNLRQAVYNLKSTLSGDGVDSLPILITGGELRFDPGQDCWLDVHAFDDALRQGLSRGAVDPHHLTTAAALYRGDFLTGFTLRDSPDFELWQLAEQERLRDQAIDALGTLVESYLSRGEFRLALQYARRLVAIDPLSEEAHRHLMRLHALCGQRSRSLGQYEELRDTLLRELGVEPLEETRALYETILTDQVPARSEDEEEEKGIGPLIPMVGRREPYRQLRESWQAVLQGRCLLTVVEGEAGVGKNRLVKSFLDAASSRRLTTILKGRCNDLVPTGYQPFDAVLRNAIAEDPQRARRALEESSPEMSEHLALLVPELRDLLPDPPAAAELRTPANRDRFFGNIARFLDRLHRPTEEGSPGEPLVLMLGDLQWAGRETVDLLKYLLDRLAATPVWILGTCSTGPLGDGSALASLLAGDDPRAPVSRVILDRLGPEAVDELASALVGDDQAVELASFLKLQGRGLPLAIAEWTNSLWDDCVLAYDAGHWRLRDSLAGLSGNLDALIQKRLHRLPTSTRRLASQAAVIGRVFDAELLRKAENEHLHVVEIGLELMLERWLIRQHSEYWRTGQRERDIVLWAKGARRGSFEFNHHLIWQSILEDINPLRRQVMHRQVAEALEEGREDGSDRLSEVLAFHYVQATMWDQAVVHLLRAAQKATALLATDTARHYYAQAVGVLDRLSAAAREPDEAATWRRERVRVAAALQEIDGSVIRPRTSVRRDFGPSPLSDDLP